MSIYIEKIHAFHINHGKLLYYTKLFYVTSILTAKVTKMAPSSLHMARWLIS